MKYLSVFSGVDAASLAFLPLGWECIGLCEIDEYASAVLAHRFPDSVNLGDICQVDWSDFVKKRGRPDVLIGGSPCQSFSIAGKRDSLKGESRLMFEYIRAVEGVRPRFLVWENTPGVLSARDNAFGQLLHALAEIGYRDLAYRVLDAQFFKLAQRRRRVFLVGHLAESGFRSAEILGLFDSSAGDTAKESEKREELAADARAGAHQPDGEQPNELIAFKWFQGARSRSMPAYDDGTTPTITNSDAHQPAIAFAQDEPMVMAHGHSHAEIGEGGVAPTVLARSFKDPPILFARSQATEGTSSQASVPPTEASNS